MRSWRVAGGPLRFEAEIARELGIGTNRARKLVQAGRALLNGKRAKKGVLVADGDVIAIDDEAFDLSVVPEARPLDVIYEDELVLAVNKPIGWPSHPLELHERGTVANAIVARTPACATASTDPREGGLVHRLDRNTTGVLVAAKSREAWEALRASFSAREVDKVYWALVQGVPRDTIIDAPLLTSGGTARVRDHVDALDARTDVRVIVAGTNAALVEARARTGRMHQIRAHLAHIGHPLFGDARYGAIRELCVPEDEAQLHARSISIPHPIDRWRIEIHAPLPHGRHALWEHLLGAKLSSA